VYIYQIKTLHN